MLYVFFWVIPRRLKVICRRFGTLCLFHLHRHVDVSRMNYIYLPMKTEQSVRKRRHINFRRQGITQKKAYNVQNTAKAWNQECLSHVYWGKKMARSLLWQTFKWKLRQVIYSRLKWKINRNLKKRNFLGKISGYKQLIRQRKVSVDKNLTSCRVLPIVDWELWEERLCWMLCYRSYVCSRRASGAADVCK